MSKTSARTRDCCFRGEVRVERPWLGKPKLVVNGRDRTKIVDGLDRQVAAVRALSVNVA